MHLAAEEVTKAGASIDEVMGILNAIVDAVMKVNNQVTQIASSREEQSAAAEEVTRNIEETSFISKMTEFIAAEVLKGSDKIIRVDEELKASFSGFVPWQRHFHSGSRDEQHHCQACGHTDNADTNAAKNILREGLSRSARPQKGAALTGDR
jgi:hypothetical protein